MSSSIDSAVLKDTSFADFTVTEITADLSEGELSEGEVKVPQEKDDSEDETFQDEKGKEEVETSLMNDPRNYGIDTGESENVFSFVDEFGQVQHYYMTPDPSNAPPSYLPSSIGPSNPPPSIAPSDRQLPQLEVRRRERERTQKRETLSTDNSEAVILPQTPPADIRLFSFRFIIPFKRFTLLQVLDKNDSIWEVISGIVLAILTTLVGFLVLPNFREFFVFSVSYSLGSSLFGLLKSPQPGILKLVTHPDTSSPRHDHNRMNAFTRPFYFLLTASLILLLDNSSLAETISIYGFAIPLNDVKDVSQAILEGYLILSPVIHFLGLLPQVHTLVMYVVEQINIHAFGSSGIH